MICFRRLIIASLFVSSAVALFGFGGNDEDTEKKPVQKIHYDDDKIKNLGDLVDDEHHGIEEEELDSISTDDYEISEKEYEALVEDKEDWEYDPDAKNFGQEKQVLVEEEYGVDVSFPMHHARVSENYPGSKKFDPKKTPQPLGNRQKFYDEFMAECRKHYGKRGSMCDSTEEDRVEMILRQPRSMVNYTDLGFKKIRAPPELWSRLQKFWEDNHDKQAPERWPAGNTYTNHWKSPTHMVSVDNGSLRGQSGIKDYLWNAAKETLSEWTDMDLTPVSLYGIRVYKEGAILAPHVDRLPLVSSAIVNVAQDVDEPWPIEVISHDGKAYNVSMEPGDMVLYESHSVIHGRPYPLKGRFYANCFIHFEPVGHSKRHHGIDEEHDVDAKHKEAQKIKQGGHEHEASDGLPDYILRGSKEERKWRQSHPNNKSSVDTRARTFATGSHDINTAAAMGDLKTLEMIINKDKTAIHHKDQNGWMALHEGVRSGHVAVAKRLLEAGADLNVRTNHGQGGSALWWAVQAHGENSEMVNFLKSQGAQNLEPEL